MGGRFAYSPEDRAHGGTVQNAEAAAAPGAAAASPIPRAAFRDPPLAAQAVFRMALEALSRPAVFRPAPTAGLFAAEPPMPPLVAALLLTLADHQTPVWLSGALRGAAGWLAFHTGAPIASDPALAAFAAAESIGSLPPLESLPAGTDRHPDTSATVIAGAEPGSGPELWAWGPGLRAPAPFRAAGLQGRFLGAWAAVRAAYPLGVDVFLCGTDRLAGLPRSVSLSPDGPPDGTPGQAPGGPPGPPGGRLGGTPPGP